MAAFSYLPASIVVFTNKDGTVKEIKLPDDLSLDEMSFYTVAIDKGGFSDDIGKIGDVWMTDLKTIDMVREYFSAHSPLTPLEHSLR